MSPTHSQPPNLPKSVERLVDFVSQRRIEALVRAGKLRVMAPDNGEYRPRMDMFEDQTSVICTFELPGVSINDVSLNIHGGNLLIKGERRLKSTSFQGPKEVATDSARWPVQELRYGTFVRLVPLPPGVRDRHVGANLTDGLLTVTWPRNILKNEEETSADDADNVEPSVTQPIVT